MAENTADDILEEGAEETQTKKKGLSNKLLISIAAGLGVLLIALIVSFFFLSKSADEVSESAEATTQTESEAATAEAETDTSEPDESIALPDVPSGETSAAETGDASAGIDPAVGLAATGAAAVTSPVTQPSTKILSELVAIQQQMANLQEENQTLIKRVEELAKENEALKAKSRQLSNTNPDAVINDEQLVNSDNVPLYYQESRSSTPQPKLEPKWGEFDNYNSDS